KALDEVEGIDRIRISSIEPNLLTNEIIEVVAQSKRFVPHFHMPLQSGSNKVLAQMRRRYKREVYAERVAKIKSLLAQCCIGLDVIVSLPRETRDDFIDTYKFINELDISYLHVFTYSERKNTIAAQMEGAVPGAQRSDRSKMLHILSEKKRRAFYETQIGSDGLVLFEGDIKDGYMHGFTKNYVKVRTPYDPLLVNEIVPVKLVALTDSGEVDVQELKEELVHS